MNVHELDLDDEGIIGVIHPPLTTIKQEIQENEEHYHRGNIFQTRVNRKQIRSLVIDTRSCTNAMSKEAVKKMGLKVKSPLDPYHVVWITNTKLKVDKQCLATFDIGKLKEIVMCDVLPLKLCHVLLGWPWIPSDTVMGMPILTLLLMATRIALTCANNMTILKLKNSSFLI